MNAKIKILKNMLNWGSFVILMTAISTTIKGAIRWLRNLATPKKRLA